MTPALETRALRLAYGATEVLHAVDLTVQAGESVALLGPSGSGKTSLLYAVAGFLAPSGGEIVLDGRTVSTTRTQEPPERRGVAMVFQHYALWPHLTAVETVAYPMRRRGMSRVEAHAASLAMLERLGLAVSRIGLRHSSQAASSSVSVSREPSREIPGSSCSTSRPPTSTRRCGRLSRRSWRTDARGRARPH